MYKSPLELIFTDIGNQIVQQMEKNCYQAVVQYVPNVDKEELIRALQYDRGQYEKGYADGKRDAMNELVRCKGCKHGIEDHEDAYLCDNPCNGLIGFTRGDDFCSYGERRDGE